MSWLEPEEYTMDTLDMAEDFTFRGVAPTKEDIRLAKRMPLVPEGCDNPEADFAKTMNIILQHPNPSIGVRFLYETGWLNHYAYALSDAWEAPQSPLHHPEGCVGNHVCEVIDRASGLKYQLPEEVEGESWRYQREIYMWAALLHDIGKGADTYYKNEKRKLTWWRDRKILQGERIVAYGHEDSGAKMVVPLLTNLKFFSEDFIQEVSTIIRFHMRPFLSITPKAVKKAKKQGCPMQMVGLLNWADKNERPSFWLSYV